jgi:hypothetical protein
MELLTPPSFFNDTLRAFLASPPNQATPKEVVLPETMPSPKPGCSLANRGIHSRSN